MSRKEDFFSKFQIWQKGISKWSMKGSEKNIKLKLVGFLTCDGKKSLDLKQQEENGTILWD